MVMPSISGIIISLTIRSGSKEKLDEYNPAGLPVETVENEKTGLEGAINGCYTDLYFFHGKQDILGTPQRRVQIVG